MGGRNVPEKDSMSEAFSTSYMLTCMSSQAVSSVRESGDKSSSSGSSRRGRERRKRGRR
jgi:hypothetical protein